SSDMTVANRRGTNKCGNQAPGWKRKQGDQTADAERYGAGRVKGLYQTGISYNTSRTLGQPLGAVQRVCWRGRPWGGFVAGIYLYLIVAVGPLLIPTIRSPIRCPTVSDKRVRAAVSRGIGPHRILGGMCMSKLGTCQITTEPRSSYDVNTESPEG